jgi:molybdopterin converting factor small subunit
MARVRFTSHLKRFFPDLTNNEIIVGTTVAEIVAQLDARHPGLGSYLVDERGALRKHVNIFIGDTLVSDHEHLQDPVHDDTTLFIFQALSGG